MASIALLGNPNSGKTTLFNALTGSNQKIGNYPGVTVERVAGYMRNLHGQKVPLIDLPGTYSLTPNSPDEALTLKVLKGQQEGEEKPSVLLCIVDATLLERHLYLVSEALELDIPIILVLNKIDRVQKLGIHIDKEALSQALGVPIIACQANAKKGIADIKKALATPPIAHPKPFLITNPQGEEENFDEHVSRQRMELIQNLCEQTTQRRNAEGSLSWSDRLDSFFLHPIAGWFFFVGFMLFVFWSIFRWAEYPMGLIEDGVHLLEEGIGTWFGEGDLRDLFIDGILEGVLSVVIFLPQVLLLLFFIGIMETTGYTARATLLMDSIMSKVGLSGKAFLPLLSSYACAIPGIMATRVMESKKQRLITIFIAPWMSCTARLPVYSLLIGLLLASYGAWMQALILCCIYFLGTFSALLTAWFLDKTLKEETLPPPFLMELPPYQWPQWSSIARHLLERGLDFLKNAGTVILGICIILWALQTYPKPQPNSPAATDSSLALEQSYMGKMGQFVEPLVKPLGYDWRTGTALIAAFAAREVFNANLAISYSVEEAEQEDRFLDNLRKTLSLATWPDGRRIYTPLTTLSLLVFFVYALQCLPTTAVVSRETGSWKWAALQLVSMALVAWLASFLVYQGGTMLLHLF